VERFLGGVEISEQADERGEDAPRLREVDGVDGVVNRAGGCHAPDLTTFAPARASVGSASAGAHI
jgi:hypothetical protein